VTTVHEAVEALFRDAGEPRRLVLHAGLERICRPYAPRLHNLVREPDWQQVVAGFQAELLRLDPDPAAWLPHLEAGLRRRPQDENRRLLRCAAALQALDATLEPEEFGQATVELPAFFGAGAKTLFLPPPEAPIEGWVPEKLKIDRGAGELGLHLPSLLDLRWRLVHLEGRPVTPRPQPLDAAVAEVLARRLEETGDLRVALASPFAGLEHPVDGDPGRCGRDGTPYRFRGLRGKERQAARGELEAILGACAEQRVDVLCLPELTVDGGVLSDLARMLAIENASEHPALVVAGSRHAGDGTRRRNRCTVLDGRGEVLFTHDKIVPFKITRAAAEAMGSDVCAKLGIDERGGYEDVDAGTELPLVDAPLGRLATPICLDFCGTELRDLMAECGVNLLLVPAMTARMDPFRQRARELGSLSRAASFVVNSAWLLRLLGQSEEARRRRLLHVYLPARGRAWDGDQQDEPTEPVHVFTMSVRLFRDKT